jgi:hypothetical protein
MALENFGTGVDITIGEGEEAVHYFSKTGVYSVSEETTAVDPADTQGAFGQLTVDIADEPAVRAYMDESILLTDGKQGSTIGNIRGLTGDGVKATITADSRLGQTAVTRQMPPFTGVLGDALRAWLAACGITTGIVVDEQIDATPVVLPGWKGIVYDQLKKLAVAHQFEMALVSGNIVFRPLRTRTAVNMRDSQITWAQDATTLAQTVEGYYYETEWRTNALAYPLGGWNQDVQVYSVDAGETRRIEIPLEMEISDDVLLSASIVSLDQPTCVAFVDRQHDSTSVYSVTGNDGIAIQPAQWAAGGGSLTVEIGEDTKMLVVTVAASMDTGYAPYSIAVSAGPSDEYSSLRIVGTGAFQQRHLTTLPAHLDPDRAPEEVGVTVDNEFFSTGDRLHQALAWTAGHYSGARQTINVTTRGIHRRGDSGVVTSFPTIDDLYAIYPGASLDDLYAALGPTVDDWNEKLFELVKDDFENQAFGNVVGARVLHDGCWYRIRNATIAYDQVTYTAEWDTTIDDAFPGTETVDEWNARWAGMTIDDFNRAPVRGVQEETW